MAIMRLPRLRVRTYLLLMGVVALLVWGTMIGVRWYEYYRRARIYSFQERHWRENAQRDLRQNNTRTIAARWGLQTADHYARLVGKYRRAMWRPWISVEFEPPFFYPSDLPISGNPLERTAGNSIRPADRSSEGQRSTP
jgi:hypothetical protein